MFAAASSSSMRRPRSIDGNSDAETEELEAEKPQLTSQQRQAISDERTKQLTQNLQELKSAVELRWKGLNADLDPHSEFSTSYYSNPHAVQEGVRKVKKKDYSNPQKLVAAEVVEDIPSPRNPNQDTSRYIAMQHSEVTTAGSIGDLQKWEEKRRKLAQALHREEAFIMNRRIDGITYSLDEEPPFDIPITLVLRYIAYAMDSGFREKRKLLFYLVKPVTRRLLLDLFWFVHCFSFQPDSVVIQEVLIQSISDLYIQLRGLVISNKELFLDCFPFAAAYAVDRCFHHFIPGSRILYTPTFKLQTYLVVARLLTGMELSPVTVQNKMLKYFPSEGLLTSLTYFSGRNPESADAKNKEDEEESDREEEDSGSDSNSEDVLRPLRRLPPALWRTSKRDRSVLGDEGSTRVESLRSLPLPLTVPLLPNAAEVLQQSRMDFTEGDDRAAAAAATVKRRQAGEGAEEKKLSVTWATTEEGEAQGQATKARGNSSSAGGLSGTVSDKEKRQLLRQQHNAQLKSATEALQVLMRRSTRRQLRVRFNVSAMSPLTQRHLRASSSVVGRPVSIKRTTPVPWCRVGGLDTFRAAPPVAKEQKAIMTEAVETRQLYTQKLAKQRTKDKIDLKAIDSACDMVKSGAIAHVTRFASAVVEARKLRAQAQHEERRQRHTRNRGKVGKGKGKGGPKKSASTPMFSKPARDSPLMKHSDVLPHSALPLPENPEDALLYSTSGIAFTQFEGAGPESRGKGMSRSPISQSKHKKKGSGFTPSASSIKKARQPVSSVSSDKSKSLGPGFQSTLPALEGIGEGDAQDGEATSKPHLYAAYNDSFYDGRRDAGATRAEERASRDREKIARSAKHMLATIDLPLGPNAMKTFDVGAGDTTALQGFTPRKSASMYGISLLPGGGVNFAPSRTGLSATASAPALSAAGKSVYKGGGGSMEALSQASSMDGDTLPNIGMKISPSVTKLLNEAFQPSPQARSTLVRAGGAQQ